MALYDDVYGLSYNSAEQQMQLLSNGIKQRDGVGGFESLEELEAWAHDYHLDKVMYHSMGHAFLCISHKGEIMTAGAFMSYYGSVLTYPMQVGNNKTVPKIWAPESFKYYDKAYINGEMSDGVHRPLYYRNYFLPTGYYSEEKDAFNVAKPFPVFAKDTGRDTSHIYTYIEHVAGECAMHLLAWLRMKMLYPNVKTQVVPIIVSRTQGSGKTTFAEVICKGLFGKDNVIVSDQYDSTARFNADYADALIVCQEEKELEDRRNPAGALKSRATATTIRKELKGVDPIYQESYTDFIMTTNKDVPIKFDGREDQRRFMVMEADPSFTRKTSALADEVFTKLYGYDANMNRKGIPFVDDKELIAQFKHELFVREDIAAVQLRNFPKTAAYNKCFSLPRTNEATEVESILRSIAPFILASLEADDLVTEVGDRQLSDVIQYTNAIEFRPQTDNEPKLVALCRPLVFYTMQDMRPMAHAVVERGIYDCATWLMEEFGLMVISNMAPLEGGFTYIKGRYAAAPAARFALIGTRSKNDEDILKRKNGLYKQLPSYKDSEKNRQGERFRVNKQWQPDPKGCFETVNEMKPGTTTLKGCKSDNVQYLDTFLFESDTPTKLQEEQERQRAEAYIQKYGENSDINARELYKERLDLAYVVSEELYNAGKVCRVVYSGAKSYHMLVRVKDAPQNFDEYRWLHAYISDILTDRLLFDGSTSDPARLTRSPVEQERVTTAYGLLVHGTQQLICENWNNVWDLQWRMAYEQWQNRPLTKYEQRRGKPLYPTRKEYRVALEALVDGTFFTDPAFDGERQHLFFPVYRLLRILGYSHDDAWNDVILPQVDKYKKRNEIGYWKTRKDSALITRIDEEIDAYEASMEESNGD